MSRSALRQASRPAFLLLALVTMVPGLAGCGYSVRGKAIKGSFPAVMYVDADDPRFAEEGAAGVSLTVTRDPGRLSAQVVGRGVSGPDGSIDIPLRDATGAGVTDEEWMIEVSGAGWGRQTTLVRLPLGDARRLLVIVAPGRSNGSDGGWQDPALMPTSFEQERNRIEQDLERFQWAP